jgi:hypothetical protein
LIFSANSKPYSKQLWPMNHGPRGDCLMKKTEGQKSRDTVPLYRYHTVDMGMKKSLILP